MACVRVGRGRGPGGPWHHRLCLVGRGSLLVGGHRACPPRGPAPAALQQAEPGSGPRAAPGPGRVCDVHFVTCNAPVSFFWVSLGVPPRKTPAAAGLGATRPTPGARRLRGHGGGWRAARLGRGLQNKNCGERLRELGLLRLKKRRLRGDLLSLCSSLRGGGREGGLGSAPQEPATGREAMASSCVRGCSGWILGKMSFLREWSGVGTGCPGQWGSPHPWRGSNTVWMWHLGTWFSRHGGAGVTVGLDDLGDLCQPVVLWRTPRGEGPAGGIAPGSFAGRQSERCFGQGCRCPTAASAWGLRGSSKRARAAAKASCGQRVPGAGQR